MRRVTPLSVFLACSVILLSTVQSLAPLTTTITKIPEYAGAHYAQALHTREEVGGGAIDFSIDATRGCSRASSNVERFAPPAVPSDLEVEVAPMRRTLHRRVSPSSPDDAFFLS